MKSTIYLLAGILGLWLMTGQAQAQNSDAEMNNIPTMSEEFATVEIGDVVLFPAKMKFTYGDESMLLGEDESGCLSLPNSSPAINVAANELTAEVAYTLQNQTENPLMFRMHVKCGNDVMATQNITLEASEIVDLSHMIIFPIDGEIKSLSLIIYPTSKDRNKINIFTTKLFATAFTL